MPQPGDQLGPYRLDRILTQTGMAVVFQGFDTTLNRFAAIKVLTPQLATIPTAVTRFKNVARAQASLKHPNCLHIDAAGEENGISYVVTELAEGATIEESIQQHATCDPQQAAELIRQAVLGLQHAAQQYIFHGYLLPGNLIVTNDGTVKVADFDLACQLAKEVDPDYYLEFFGTPQYLSPEVAEGRVGDQRSDIYSLGAIAYHLLTGQPPVTGLTTAAVLEQQRTQTPTPIVALRPEVPAALAQLIERMLSTNAKDRPQQYQELIAELDKFLRPPASAPVKSGPVAETLARPVAKPAPAKQQPRLGGFAPAPAKPTPTAGPGDRPLQHRPLPTTAPTPKPSSAGMLVGVLVSLLLVAAGVWYYFKTAPESVRNMSLLTVVVPQADTPATRQAPTPPPPKALTPQEQGEKDFQMVKRMADSLITQSAWVEAWNLYDQFLRSPRYRGTTLPATADAERQRVRELVIKSWEDAKPQIQQLITDGKFDDALAICDKYTGVGREIPALNNARIEESLRTVVAKLNAAADVTTEWKDIAKAVGESNWDNAVRRLQQLLDRAEDPFVKAHNADLQRFYDLLFAKPSVQKDQSAPEPESSPKKVP